MKITSTSQNGKLYSCSGSVLAKHSIIDKYPYLLTLSFICVVYCLYLIELNIYDLLAFLILHKLLGHSPTSGPIATTWTYRTEWLSWDVQTDKNWRLRSLAQCAGRSQSCDSRIGYDQFVSEKSHPIKSQCGPGLIVS